MLGYQHGFHAGNHADVLKHSVLALVLDYLVRKDKPLLYLDTHAGSGMYGLRGERASKNTEYETGIGRLWPIRAQAPAALQPYLQCIAALNPSGGLQRYPGSPVVAQAWLRPQDRACLFEVHPNEFRYLHERFAGHRRIRAEASDGFHALRALLPPPERRALVLVDPPYEEKSDYPAAVQALGAAWTKFTTGVYLLWYPVLNRKQVSRLESALVRTGVRNLLQAELTISPDTQHAGMTGSGMLVVNPPWQLAESLQSLLPYLQQQLSGPGGNHRLRQLVTE